MSELTGLNGTPLVNEKKRTITLEYDLRTTRLNIGGEIENIDLTINLLEQALRYFKNQQLVTQIISTGQALERDARLAQAVFKQ